MLFKNRILAAEESWKSNMIHTNPMKPILNHKTMRIVDRSCFPNTRKSFSNFVFLLRLFFRRSILSIFTRTISWSILPLDDIEFATNRQKCMRNSFEYTNENILVVGSFFIAKEIVQTIIFDEQKEKEYRSEGETHSFSLSLLCLLHFVKLFCKWSERNISTDKRQFSSNVRESARGEKRKTIINVCS